MESEEALPRSQVDFIIPVVLFISRAGTADSSGLAGAELAVHEDGLVNCALDLKLLIACSFVGTGGATLIFETELLGINGSTE